MAQEVFKRYEKKYILTKPQYKGFIAKASDRLAVDQYGRHTICNIYFDTKNYSLIRSSIEKPVYKEKLRLRSYGVPTMNSPVFLEIKKKYDGIVYKRRAEMTLLEAYKYLSGGGISRQSQILSEIDWFMKFYEPIPKVYLAYDRIAMYDTCAPEVRITFDTNIRWRSKSMELEKGAWGNVLLDENSYIMEVKIADAMPMWLADILDELEIYPSSYSKYGTCYEKYLSKGICPTETEKTSIGGIYCA